MPEGWKRWKAWAMLEVNIRGMDACDLMKEMAEALDDVVNHQCFSGEILEETEDKCENILRKFQEWK